MRHIIQEEISYLKCDLCNSEEIYNAVSVEFGYGSIYDDERTHHFCSDECFIKWVDLVFKPKLEKERR